MPTYEYHCDSCAKNFDVVQSFQDDPLTSCPTCGSPVRKVFGNVGIVFKGSGFYKTDSRSGGSKKDDGGDGSPATNGSEGSSTDGGDAKPAAPAGDVRHQGAGIGLVVSVGTGAVDGPGECSDEAEQESVHWDRKLAVV